ncbi:60 kDa lysophospholipase isoform X9 [Lemur catta]|uniref:60 kDa lysophospholipase isoform X9 n=1 Tax=Lemur catta TaxID=9447 RepID=UPI001E26DD9E|nr:60 kDa lysophospholipase isoform X9 [Lemur catta]
MMRSTPGPAASLRTPWCCRAGSSAGPERSGGQGLPSRRAECEPTPCLLQPRQPRPEGLLHSAGVPAPLRLQRHDHHRVGSDCPDHRETLRAVPRLRGHPRHRHHGLRCLSAVLLAGEPAEDRCPHRGPGAHPRPVERRPREPAGGAAHGRPNQLFRGNRTTKVDARRFAAFCSPNLPPLATVGADVTINRELVRKVGRKARLVVHDSMERDVGLLRLYPGIPASLVRAFLQPPMKGLVMETFGSGNGPTKPDLLRELRAAAERGLVIVNCTHCLQGTVTSGYATGMAMAGAGIVSGLDMTSEAALAKLSYVLGQPGLSLDDRKELLAKDLRGEMTLPTADACRPSLLGSTWGRGVAWLLSLSGSQEADAVRDALTPSLACAAAHAGDLEALQVLVELGSDLSLEDFRGQTPLHTAARGGHARVVSMLLQRGVDVNARDKDGLSPLLLAIRGRHQGVIGLLRAAGACLSTQELEDSGTELCRLASRADGDGLWAWWQAGADLRQPGYDGRSALHVAEAAGNLEVVAFLQSLAGGHC